MNPLYAANGARGVRVAPEWDRFEPYFEWAVRAGWKPGLCLLRVDRDGDYSPQNCRFAPKQALVPLRRPPARPKQPWVLITAFGVTKGLTAWTRDRRCQVTAPTLRDRLRGGMHPEDALSTPPQNAGKSGQGTRLLTAFGETKTLVQWLEDPRCRISATGLELRIRRGMPVEAALTTPPFMTNATPSERDGGGSVRRKRVQLPPKP